MTSRDSLMYCMCRTALLLPSVSEWLPLLVLLPTPQAWHVCWLCTYNNCATPRHNIMNKYILYVSVNAWYEKVNLFTIARSLLPTEESIHSRLRVRSKPCLGSVGNTSTASGNSDRAGKWARGAVRPSRVFVSCPCTSLHIHSPLLDLFLCVFF